jgi:hypothetical protein
VCDFLTKYILTFTPWPEIIHLARIIGELIPSAYFFNYFEILTIAENNIRLKSLKCEGNLIQYNNSGVDGMRKGTIIVNNYDG